MNLLIAGDFCPVNRAEKILSEGQSLFSENLYSYWNKADFRVANLECPITNEETKILKSGPNLKASKSVSKGLSNLNISAVSLANNHIMDFGKKGFIDTCDILDDQEISYFGIEKENKSIPGKIFETNGVRVVVLSYSIAEFCLAEDFDGNGARAIDIIKIIEDFNEYRSKVDHIIVLLHMGLYLLPYPSPRQQELCHFLVRQGAGAVLCQHSHVCGAVEMYKGAIISYGQGSFLFDLNKKKSHWNEGYFVALDINSKTISASIQGTIQFDSELQIDLMSDDQQNSLLNRLEQYKEVLSEKSLLKAEYKKSAIRNKSSYYGMITSPSGRVLNAIKRRINIGGLIPRSMKATLLNMYRNEEHNEIIQEILKSDLNG